MRVDSEREHWARCFHPTVMTLNMTASQRVEGMLGIIKKGRYINRRSSFVRVKEELEKRFEEAALSSQV